jgi:hypothetical protein
MEKYYSVEKPLVLDLHNDFCNNLPFFDTTTLIGLRSDYKIIILKHGNSFILDEKYKTEWEVLSEYNKHGYSSGVAFSNVDNYIVYWAVAW